MSSTNVRILFATNTTGEFDMKDEFDGFVGWGEGIDSGCIEDEHPDF